jgi:hypothetical protein
MNNPDRNTGKSLNALPPLDPPPALWRAIETELDQQQTSRRHRRWTLISTSIAAAIVLAVVVGLVRQPDIQPAAQAGSDSTLVQARQVSALLEAQLRQQSLSAVSTSSVESLVWLEQELGWLDMRLATNPNDLELWQRRAELLGEMNQLYGQNSWQAQMLQTRL